jgi:hypothetical protein
MRVDTVRSLRGLLASAVTIGVVLLALSGRGAMASDNDQQKGVALIDRATQLENLLSADAGSLRLRTDVKLFGLVEGTREGEYLLVVASPTRWFESVRFPGYSELRGVYDGQRWRKRNVVDKPFRFHEVSQLLDVAQHLRLPSNAVIKKLTQRTIGGAQAICAEASPTSYLWQKDSARMAAKSVVGTSKDSRVTLCFDAASGALLGATYAGDLPRFEYEGEVTLGNKTFPKTLRCYDGRELAVEATVKDLSKEANADPAGFKPPEGAETWPDCAEPTMPKLIEKQPLDEDLLAHAKAKRSFGTITCLAEVATDGTIHDLAAFEWHGMLGELIRQAVKGWRYAPATCNGTPVPAQIYIAYTFTP